MKKITVGVDRSTLGLPAYDPVGPRLEVYIEHLTSALCTEFPDHIIEVTRYGLGLNDVVAEDRGRPVATVVKDACGRRHSTPLYNAVTTLRHSVAESLGYRRTAAYGPYSPPGGLSAG